MNVAMLLINNGWLNVFYNPYKYTDPNGEFLFTPQVGAGIIGFAIGTIAEAVGNENASLGSVIKAGGVGAAVGVATTFGGGLLGTMAVGGAANGLGEVTNQAIDGEFNPEGVAEAVAIGTVGGAVAGRGLPNNTATQASHNTTASSSQRVLADSKTLSSTPANRAVAEVKLGGAYGTGAAATNKLNAKMNIVKSLYEKDKCCWRKFKKSKQKASCYCI